MMKTVNQEKLDELQRKLDKAFRDAPPHAKTLSENE